MRDHVGRIRELGAELVVVGNGSVEQAQWFRDREALDFPLFTDPTLESYRLAGLKRGLATVSPLALGRAVSAFARGYRQTRTKGDAWQLGGAFVIAAGGALRYQFASSSAGNHPDPEDLIAALAEPKT